MKLLKIQIKAKSSFMSYPKGDMIFGHFCWLLEKEKIKELVDEYKDSPKVIFSDFLPKGYLPKASLPDTILFNDYTIEKRKAYESKKYISWDNFFKEERNDKEYKEIDFIQKSISTHNSISRLTNSTDDEQFKPYNLESFLFKEDIELYILFYDDFISKELLIKKMENIGKIGFGKRSSVGYGQFEIINSEELVIDYNSKYSITLSPSNITQKSFYKPYTKFGRYGNKLAYMAYKNPLIMGDSSAVVKSNEKYIGSSIVVDEDIKIDDTKTNIIHQGYSILLPFKGYEEFLNGEF